MTRRRIALGVVVLALLAAVVAGVPRVLSSFDADFDGEPRVPAGRPPSAHGVSPETAGADPEPTGVDSRLRSRRHVQPPTPTVRRKDRTHVDIAGLWGRGRIVDERGEPIAGVSVRFQSVRVEEDISADSARNRGATVYSHSPLEHKATFIANRRVTTDADGWFEHRIGVSGGSLEAHPASHVRLVILALIPGRRPLRASLELGRTASDTNVALPRLANGDTVVLSLREQPLSGLSVRIHDVTDGAQLPHGERTTDHLGRISTEWLERGRTYMLSGTLERSRIHGAFAWEGQEEIDVGRLNAGGQ